MTAWFGIQIHFWANCSCAKTTRHGFSVSVQQALERKSLIALYKSSDTSVDNKIIMVERLYLTQPWRYLYYTPKYYTDLFYININHSMTTFDYDFVLGDSDTLLGGTPYQHHPFNQLPKRIIISSRGHKRVYNLAVKFQENIDNIASIPFTDKLDFGPYYCDD